MISIRKITRQQAEKVLSDDELWGRLKENDDDLPKLPDSNMYIGCFDGDDLRGFFILASENGTTVEVHANLLKSGRASARSFVHLLFKSLLAAGLQKLNTKISACHPEIRNFALNHGFSDEGIDRQSAMHRGKMHDRYIMGITRQEMQSWVDE